MKAKTLAALCFITSTTVAAVPAQERWVAVSGDVEVVYSVELSSIKPRGQYVRAWIHAEFSRARDDGFVGYGQLKLYNCADEESALTQITGYRAPMRGRPNATETFEPTFTVSPPGSSGAQVLEFICAYSKGETWAVEAKAAPMPVSPSSLQ